MSAYDTVPQDKVIICPATFRNNTEEIEGQQVTKKHQEKDIGAKVHFLKNDLKVHFFYNRL